MNLLNNFGCIFGGGGKTPSPPPTPAPAPVPTAAQGTIGDEEGRRKRLERQRMGLAATIKTSPRGIFGGGADLAGSNQGGKSKLGA